MKKSSILLMAVLAGLMACERVEIRKEKHPGGKLKARWEVTVSKKKERRNGTYEEFYESGKIKSIVNYIDDKEHGVYKAYHTNGRLSAEIQYVGGVMDGDYKEWYEDGSKKRFAEYKEGKLDGTIRIWDAGGNQVSQAKFKNGQCQSGDCGRFTPAAAVGLN